MRPAVFRACLGVRLAPLCSLSCQLGDGVSEEEPDEPTKRLWVTYSKARKHDENGELKALLDEYFQNDARIGELNRRIVRELEYL